MDAMLAAAGWTVQDIASLNLHASRGVAVREMQSHGGPADYILFVGGKALGIVEAKKEGTIDPTVLATVTPDAGAKTRFVLVDVVGVTQSDKNDSRPMECKPSFAFDKPFFGKDSLKPVIEKLNELLVA